MTVDSAFPCGRTQIDGCQRDPLPNDSCESRHDRRTIACPVFEPLRGFAGNPPLANSFLTVMKKTATKWAVLAAAVASGDGCVDGCVVQSEIGEVMKRMMIRTVVLLSALAMATGMAKAGSYTWNGSVNGTWTTLGNWTVGGSVPGNYPGNPGNSQDDDVTFGVKTGTPSNPTSYSLNNSTIYSRRALRSRACHPVP